MTASPVKSQRNLKTRTKKAHTPCVIFFPSKFCIDFFKFSQDRKSQQRQKGHSDKQVFHRTMLITIFFSFLHFLPPFHGWQQRVCSARWDTPKLSYLTDRQKNRYFLMQKKWQSYFKISWALILGRNFLFHMIATGSAKNQDP